MVTGSQQELTRGFGVNALQVQCFGLGMVKLDIRQESTRHSDVLDTITTYLGIGSYKCAAPR